MLSTTLDQAINEIRTERDGYTKRIELLEQNLTKLLEVKENLHTTTTTTIATTTKEKTKNAPGLDWDIDVSDTWKDRILAIVTGALAHQQWGPNELIALLKKPKLVKGQPS